MIFNDFAPLYSFFGKSYFKRKDDRAASLAYYGELINALVQRNVNIKPIVEKIMLQTQKIWQEMR